MPQRSPASPVDQFAAPPDQAPPLPVKINVPFINVSQVFAPPLQSPTQGQYGPICGGPLAGKAGEAGHSLAVEIPLTVADHVAGQEQLAQPVTVTHCGELQFVGAIVSVVGQPDPLVEPDKVNELLPLQLKAPF